MEVTITLPSKGRFYQEAYPDWDGKITFRILNAGDEQKIFGSSSSSTLDRVLNSLIIEPAGFDINNLVPGDKNFFMYKVRIATYGERYKQFYYCPLCNNEGEIEFSIEEIEVHELDDKIKLPLRIKLPVSGDIIELRVQTCNQINRLEDRAQKTSKNTGADYKEIIYALKLAKRIAAVNEKNLDSYEAEKYMREIHPRDRAYIDSAFKSIKLGYANTLTVNCPKCGKNIVIPFEMNSEFFNPSDEVDCI